MHVSLLQMCIFGVCSYICLIITFFKNHTRLVLIKPVGSRAAFINLASDTVLYLIFSIHSGENRLRYFQLLMNGSYTPWTLPVGGEEAREVSPRILAEALLVKPPLTACQRI